MATEPIVSLIAVAENAFLSKALGSAAEHMGELALKQAKQIAIKAAAYLSEVGREPQAIESKLLVPLIQAAALETDETLSDMWAALLANAADSASEAKVQISFVEVLRQLTRSDIYLLNALYFSDERAKASISNSYALDKPFRSDVRFAIDNLIRLRLFKEERDKPEFEHHSYIQSLLVTDFGYGFMRAIMSPARKLRESALPSEIKHIVEPRHTVVPVFIGLPQEDIDAFTVEIIKKAAGEFMEAMGFELLSESAPIIGSFFQKLKYFFKGPGKAAATEALEKGKLALETQHITLPAAEATGKLAEAAAALITSLNGVEEAVLRLGSLLVVKVSRNGLPAIMAETVSPELAQLLDKNPGLLKTPTALFDMLTAMQLPTKKIDDGSAGVLNI